MSRSGFTFPFCSRMKPAVFDLFLAIGIAGYSLLWYCSLMVRKNLHYNYFYLRHCHAYNHEFPYHQEKQFCYLINFTECTVSMVNILHPHTHTPLGSYFHPFYLVSLTFLSSFKSEQPNWNSLASYLETTVSLSIIVDYCSVC